MATSQEIESERARAAFAQTVKQARALWAAVQRLHRLDECYSFTLTWFLNVLFASAQQVLPSICRPKLAADLRDFG